MFEGGHRPAKRSVPAVTDFISVSLYDLFHENSHVPRIRKDLPPLLVGVRRSILEVGTGTGLITVSLADWDPGGDFQRAEAVGAGEERG
jgi:hypothetical protein